MQHVRNLIAAWHDRAFRYAVAAIIAGGTVVVWMLGREW